MHAGRVSHPDNKDGHETVAPSALAAPGEMFTARGMRPHPVPRALQTAEVPSVIGEYAHAARSAVEAGLDGIELHCANGYLPHRFLAPSTNHRTDAYGGSATARARFVIELAHAVAEAIGSERVGVRISPGINLHGAIEDDPAQTAATYRALIDGIAPLGLAYLHTIGDPADPLLLDLRVRFGGPLVVSDGWYPMTDAATARRRVATGQADLVAVGRAFIANPDLVRRWQYDAPLNRGRRGRGVDPRALPGVHEGPLREGADAQGGGEGRAVRERHLPGRVKGVEAVPGTALGAGPAPAAQRAS